MKKLIVLFLVLFTISAYSQDRSKFLYAEFADKSITYWPFYTVFGENYDPAITLGAGIDYRENGNFTLFQTLQLNGFTTRVAGQGITLNTSIGYRYSLPFGLFGEASAGLGTTAFLPSRQTFKQDENGDYVPANPLKVLASLPLDFVVGYGKNKISLYLKYRYMIEGPYSEGLGMWVVPSSLVGIGVRYNFYTANN